MRHRFVYGDQKKVRFVLVNELPRGFVEGVAEDSIVRTADAFFAHASPSRSVSDRPSP